MQRERPTDLDLLTVLGVSCTPAPAPGCNAGPPGRDPCRLTRSTVLAYRCAVWPDAGRVCPHTGRRPGRFRLLTPRRPRPPPCCRSPTPGMSPDDDGRSASPLEPTRHSTTPRTTSRRLDPTKADHREQAHVPAEQPPPGQDPWLPPPDEHPRGTGDPRRPPPEGPLRAVGLTSSASAKPSCCRSSTGCAPVPSSVP